MLRPSERETARQRDWSTARSRIICLTHHRGGARSHPSIHPPDRGRAMRKNWLNNLGRVELEGFVTQPPQLDVFSSFRRRTICSRIARRKMQMHEHLCRLKVALSHMQNGTLWRRMQRKFARHYLVDW